MGNGDGFIGIGKAKGKEVGHSIRKAIDNAKLNIIEIKRGCGSWECGCGQPHSLPFEVQGRCGSVEVLFKPAPRGISLAVGDVAKSLMTLAGINDAWGFAKGNTKTKVNYATATFEALRMTSTMRVTRPSAETEHRQRTVGITIRSRHGCGGLIMVYAVICARQPDVTITSITPKLLGLPGEPLS